VAVSPWMTSTLFRHCLRQDTCVTSPSAPPNTSHSGCAFWSVAAACRLLGKTPNRDIDLVGYDNYWIDVAERSQESTAPLATIDKGNVGIGHALVELLTSRLAGTLPPEPQHRLVEPRLIALEPPAAT